MRRTLHCIHFRGMMDHDTCEAGIAYATFQGVPFNDRPCFCRGGKVNEGLCDKMQFPTKEELEVAELEFAKHCQEVGQARTAIVEHLGGVWKRGGKSAGGQIDCPVCKGKQMLTFTRAGVNGHIHARCQTLNCVAWME